MKVLLVMGPPGSGKGTQAKKLGEQYGIAHISTGDLFRREIGDKTKLGIEAQKYIELGQYVPDETTIGMLENRILSNDCLNGFILDGFPRTKAQAEFLDHYLESKNTRVEFAIYYDVSDEIVVQRIKGRAKEDEERGQAVRKDDLDEKIIQQRLNTYHSQTKPVLDYYEQRGVVVKIDASKSVDEIFSETVKLI